MCRKTRDTFLGAADRRAGRGPVGPTLAAKVFRFGSCVAAMSAQEWEGPGGGRLSFGLVRSHPPLPANGRLTGAEEAAHLQSPRKNKEKRHKAYEEDNIHVRRLVKLKFELEIIIRVYSKSPK